MLLYWWNRTTRAGKRKSVCVGSWATRRSTQSVLGDTARELILPNDFAALVDYVSPHMLSHTYTPHVRTHINIQYTHEQVKQFGAGSITPSSPPTELWDPRDQTREGEDWGGGGGGVRPVTIYLSVCLFLLVPSPLQLSHSLHQPLTHPLLHTSSSFVLLSILFLPLLPLWQLKTKVELFKNVDLKQINTQCSAAIAVLIKLDFLLEFTALFVHCVCTHQGVVFYVK